MTENLHPGSPGWEESLKARREAALAWLSANRQMPLVMPWAVAKDLLPSGMDIETFAPIVERLIPGEAIDSVELIGNDIVVTLKER